MEPLKERILNLDKRDYHMHTSSLSDWIPTINELVQFAWNIWLKEIAITDHSQFCIDYFRKKENIYLWNTAFYSIKRFNNVFNNVKVIFWVEWDLLNKNWDVCFDIQWIEPEFIILSAHKDIYCSDPSTITDATIKAIKKYHKKIKFIWHPCSNSDFWKYFDIKKLVETANKYKVPLEFNAKNLVRWKTNLEKLDYLLKNTNKIYLNSDAHSLYELKTVRQKAIEFLYENKYL
jgi:histidinol phosphatase-like PHP family hydrolase